jgi:hypothetical protein
LSQALKKLKSENKVTNTNEGEEMVPPRFTRMIILEQLATKNWNKEVVDMTFPLQRLA